MELKRSTIRLGVALGGGLLIATTIASPATAAGGDAVIKNNSSSDRSFRVCKDWSGTASDPGCRAGTSIKTLKPGQNTKTEFRWADADGREIPSGCRDNYGNRGPKWVKVSGFFGQTKGFTLSC